MHGHWALVAQPDNLYFTNEVKQTGNVVNGPGNMPADAAFVVNMKYLQPPTVTTSIARITVAWPAAGAPVLANGDLDLTNAAGSLNTELTPGSLMVISDHINLMGVNPLIGPNEEKFGPRFPDLSVAYDPDLQSLVIDEANAMGLSLRRGVYASLTGPSYETPAEIHMVRTLGADAVGMSTVPEAIVARHMEMRVIGISCITNLAAGVSSRPIDHSQVMEIGESVRGQFTELLRRVIAKLG